MITFDSINKYGIMFDMILDIIFNFLDSLINNMIRIKMNMIKFIFIGT